MKKYSAILIVIIIVGAIFGGYQLFKNKSSTSSIPQENVNFFDRPTAAGTEKNSTTEPPTSAAPTPSTTKEKITTLEKNLQNQQPTPTNYNELATLYYQQGNKDKAMEIINEGLAKNPNDASLLRTKDLLTYLWPNL